MVVFGFMSPDLFSVDQLVNFIDQLSYLNTVRTVWLHEAGPSGFEAGLTVTYDCLASITTFLLTPLTGWRHYVVVAPTCLAVGKYLGPLSLSGQERSCP